MSDLQLTKIKLRQGIWEGLITASQANKQPAIDVTHAGHPVPDIRLTAGAANTEWHLLVTIPKEAIADGVQTLLITDKTANQVLGHISLMSGEDLGDDMRTEIDLLRAELDLLKRAFRRHCVETA